MSARTTRELLQKTLDTLPKDATLEDAMECLCLLAKIETAREQMDRGETLPHEDVGRQMGF